MAAQQRGREGGVQLAGPAAEADPLGRFTCPVCLEVYEKPVRVPCGHIFCSACLQECLKPKKPVCGVCRSPLAPGVRAVELERQIESTETSCHGCHKNFFLSKIRAHVATCSKYQNYIMEGVKATTKDASLQPRNVPNRYTFPCPYCPEKNFDQEGLVEHCKLSHSMDTKPVQFHFSPLWKKACAPSIPRRSHRGILASRGRQRTAPRDVGKDPLRQGRRACPGRSTAEVAHFRENLTPQHQNCHLSVPCNAARAFSRARGRTSGSWSAALGPCPRPWGLVRSLLPPRGHRIASRREGGTGGRTPRWGAGDNSIRPEPRSEKGPFTCLSPAWRTCPTDWRKMESPRPSQWCWEP
ncbi:E3 ubiquitin-protein ligase RNF114 isoform X1 [Cynocephalus volans]|uniref:E3 ubiquitin-protein ligase RNF114 isoform X1 n=1 Tax=Cynocephalus volans TaxID=110931 RepID=UPI002FC61A47